MDGKNEIASTVRADNTAFRNKTVNLPTIQRSQSRVGPVTTCRELRKGTKTTDRCTPTKGLTKLIKRQAMPIFVEKSNEAQEANI